MSDTKKQQTLMDGSAAYALTATRYSAWVRVYKLREVGIAIHVPTTGTPIGTWSVEASLDDLVIAEELRTGTAPASTAAKKVTLTLNTVHGSALANADGAAQNTYVALTQGLPVWIRVVYTRASGGSSSSLPVVWLMGAGWV